MILPPCGCCSFIARNASCAQRKHPVRLVATTSFQSSSWTSSIGDGTPKLPALLNRRSTRSRPLNSPRTASASVTSVGMTVAWSEPPAVSRSVSSRRPASATVHPESSSARATSRPIPEPAPVTTAVRAASVMGGISPDIAVSPVARELARDVELHRYRQHEHAPVVARRANDAVRRQRVGRSLPRLPATGGVEAQGIVGRSECTELVRAAHRSLDRAHQHAAMTVALPVRAHRDALHVTRAQGASAVEQPPLHDGRVTDDLPVLVEQRVHTAQAVLPVVLGELVAEDIAESARAAPSVAGLSSLVWTVSRLIAR